MGCRLDFSLSWTLQVYEIFSVFAGKKRKGIPLTKVVVGVHRQPTMIPELKVFCNGFCLFCASPVSVRYISEMFDQRFFLKFYKELIIIIIIIIIIFLFLKKLQLICLKKKKKKLFIQNTIYNSCRFKKHLGLVQTPYFSCAEPN